MKPFNIADATIEEIRERRNIPKHEIVVPTLDKIFMILAEALEESGGCDHTGLQGHGKCSCPLNRVAETVQQQLEKLRKDSA